MTLDELIREGERLHANRAAAVGLIEQVGCDSWLGLYYSTHGPTLLAVAKAAVEMRESEKERNAIREEPCSCDKVCCDRCWRLASNVERGLRSRAAFDRAAGDGQK